ncbi:MAG: hypothetical protein HQK79_06985 [Desulfobacterales bacterium]|nr:hypothetical protein [Desulfobacterales bacterium]
MEGLIHSKLRKTLAVDTTESNFLLKLTHDEQIKLSEIIEKRLEKNDGTFLSMMGIVSGFLPTFLRVKLAQDKIGPEVVAKLTSHVPVKQAIETAKKMRIDFLVEVAIHQKPENIVEIVEGAPDDFLINITREMIRKGHFEKLGAFSDHLSPRKMKVLAEKLSDIEGIIQVGYHMTNRRYLVETAIQFDDDYMLKLMQGISKYGYYEIAAIVGETLPIDRQVRLLKRLKISEAAKIALHFNPESSAKIIERIDVELAVAIALHMSGKILGNIFNVLTANSINAVLPYLSHQKIEESIPFINRKHLENISKSLSPQVSQILKKYEEIL